MKKNKAFFAGLLLITYNFFLAFSTLAQEANQTAINNPETSPLGRLQPSETTPGMRAGMPEGPVRETPDGNLFPDKVASSAESTQQGRSKGQEITINKEKISLDLKGIDIIELLRILSLKTNLTIVPSKSVSGRVNIFLNNLTFDDALDVLLISQDLACDRKGNIINIMTSAEYERLYGRKYNEKRKIETIKVVYAKPATIFNALSQIKSDIGKIIADEASGTLLLIDIPEKVELMKQVAKELDNPLETTVFDLKYAKSADIKTHLTEALTSGTGELFVDERSGKVVVSDLPEKMKKIKRIVKTFDAETRQVFIEAEILQITLRDEFQKGINWEKVFRQSKLDDLNIKGTFPVSASFTPSPELSTAAIQMTIGTLTNDHYAATLQFLQSFGDTKILSRPRIATINNQEAKILVGSREAYITSTLSQAQSTTVTSESIQFVDVGVKLNVIPMINTDGFVTMKIKPEVSSVRETITTALGSKIPIVETSEAETTVKVKDGSMIMIAGLMKEDKRKESLGVPWLSKIPVLGEVFRAKSSQKKETEIIVFITPHIISGESALPGTEKESLFPPDIIPKDMAEEIISKRVEQIKIGQPEKEENQARPEEKTFTRSPSSNAGEDIKKKAKGLKDY